MDRRSQEFRRSIVEKVVENPHISVSQLIEEAGVSRASFYRWLKIFGVNVLTGEKRTVSPASWSYPQKLKVLLESQNLGDDELGVYLRKHGLFYSTLVQWRTEILDDVKKNKPVDEKKMKEAQYLRKIRELEAELKMKDRALKEATAIINLKKKAELILPVIEVDELEENTEKRPSSSSKKPKKKAPE